MSETEQYLHQITAINFDLRFLDYAIDHDADKGLSLVRIIDSAHLD